MNLKECNAVVTGGGVRLGRAMAIALAEAGANVAVHYNSSEGPAKEVAAEVERHGVKAALVQADLSGPVEAASTIFKVAQRELGPIHVLINSAAIFEQSDLLSTTEDQWDRHQTINLKAPFFVSQAFVRQLPADQQGHIINIVDWRGTRPPADYIAYTPTKVALVGLTKSLAQSLAPQVQVNAIAPGAILPGPQETEEHFEARRTEIPMRRIGDPAFISDAMLYFLRSEFVTGEVMHVTGGESL
ncbi:MAG: SDR family oxidoreductase [Planctomycetaceae bacterium]